MKLALLAAAAISFFIPQIAAALASVKNLPPLRLPIVLVHGATANGANFQIGPFNLGPYWEGIPEFLSTGGAEVKVVVLPTDGSIAERAAVLKNFLETDLKGKMVNIIGHSIGGLDARYAVSILKSMQIATITTIGTPHRGTPLADWAYGQAERGGVWYWIFRLFGYNLRGRRFLAEITTSGMKRFNDKVYDSSEVKYFSVSTHARISEGTMSGLFYLTSKWLEGQEHYLTSHGHDGMVPLDSMIWGKEIAPAAFDHLAQINHHELRFANLKQESLQMWANVYDNLQKEGY